jgi:hypothetical protein
VLVVITLLGATAVAQEARPTPEQVVLLEQAYAAYQEDKVETAIVFWERSLELGELASTWAVLGRARFNANDCQGTHEAFSRALGAPRDDAGVVAQVAKYREDLQTGCGRVEIVCDPPDQTVRIDLDQAERSCGVLWLSPGTHVIHAAPGDVAQAHRLRVKSGEISVLRIAAPAPTAAADPVEPHPDGVPVEGGGGAASDAWSLGTWGIITAGAGVAVGATAVVLDQLVAVPAYGELEDNTDPARDAALRSDFQQSQTTVLVVGIVGAVALVGGIILWVIAPDDGPAPLDGDNTAFSLGFGRDSLVWTMSW